MADHMEFESTESGTRHHAPHVLPESSRPHEDWGMPDENGGLEIMSEGDQHHALVGLVRENPGLIAIALKKGRAGQVPPQGARLRDASENLSILRPLKLSGDNVLVFEDENKNPVFGVIFEVQLGIDRQKRFRWVLYYYLLRDRLNQRLKYPDNECPVAVVVFAPNAEVAAWAGMPVTDKSGNVFRPIVVGPDQLPEITDIETARINPALAVISLAAHPLSDAAARTAVLATEDLPKAQRDILFQAIVAIARNIKGLQEMSTAFNEFTSDFARQHYQDGRKDAFLAAALQHLRLRPGEIPDEAVKIVSAAPADELADVVGTAELLVARDLSVVLARLRAASTRPSPKKTPKASAARSRRSAKGSAQAAEAPPAGQKQRQRRRRRRNGGS
jgi:hypothetical protein